MESFNATKRTDACSKAHYDGHYKFGEIGLVYLTALCQMRNDDRLQARSLLASITASDEERFAYNSEQANVKEHDVNSLKPLSEQGSCLTRQ